MADDNQNLNMQTRISLVERDINQFSQMTRKLDDTISKLTEISTAVKQILAVHEERFKNLESDYSEARLASHKMQQSVDKIVEDLNVRIKDLEKWRWYLAGIFIAIMPLVQIFLKKVNIN